MGLSYLDAAEEVLRRHSPGGPLHYRRIAALAILDGLVVPRGSTPEATMNAAITQDIKKQQAAGRPQRFRSLGRGMYSLAAQRGALGSVVDRANEAVQRRLRELLAQMDPRTFEVLIGNLLTSLGFEDVEVTRYSGDGGIDLRARLSVGGVTDVRTAVQVKRWGKNLTGKTIRELRGGIGPHERGLVITLSDFTRDAYSDAAAEDRAPISLINGTQLIRLLMDNEVGVIRTTVTSYEVDEGFFTPSEEVAPDDVEAGRQASSGTNAGNLERRTDRRSTWTWPLPGGRHAWKQTLDDMLAYVARTAPTMRDAVDWLIVKHKRLGSPEVARRYWQVPRTFGLLEIVGERLSLTADGTAYLESTNSEDLLRLMTLTVAGFQDILKLLEMRGMTSVELLEELRSQLGVEWSTDAQVGWRLGWLENLGVIAQSGRYWALRAT